MRKKSSAADRAGQKGVRSHVERDRSRPQGQAGTERVTDVADRPVRMASVGARSLMKTSSLATGQRVTPRSSVGLLPSAPAAKVPPRKPSTPANSHGRQQKIEERVAAASEELAAGITEAASAAEELRRAMEQIASGAEEAASASQETLAVATITAATLLQARDQAETARRRTETLQGLLADTSNQIGAWASNIKHNGERQAARSPSSSS